MLTGNVLLLNKEYEYRIFISLLSIINKYKQYCNNKSNCCNKKVKNYLIVVTGNSINNYKINMKRNNMNTVCLLVCNIVNIIIKHESINKPNFLHRKY